MRKDEAKINAEDRLNTYRDAITQHFKENGDEVEAAYFGIIVKKQFRISTAPATRRATTKSATPQHAAGGPPRRCASTRCRRAAAKSAKPQHAAPRTAAKSAKPQRAAAPPLNLPSLSGLPAARRATTKSAKPQHAAGVLPRLR